MKQIFLAIGLALLFSCARQSQKPIDTDPGNCESATVVNSDKFSQKSPAGFTITKAEIKGDCLEITITASGCDGKTWKAELVSDGAVAESYPPQMYLKVLLTSSEECLAVLSKEFSYNLKSLRVPGMNKVSLNLQGWNQQLLYQY